MNYLVLKNILLNYNDYYKSIYNKLIEKYNPLDNHKFKIDNDLYKKIITDIFNQYNINNNNYKEVSINYLIKYNDDLNKILVEKYNLSKELLVKYYSLLLLKEYIKDGKIIIDKKYINEINDKINIYQSDIRYSNKIINTDINNLYYALNQLLYDNNNNILQIDCLKTKNQGLINLQNYIKKNM